MLRRVRERFERSFIVTAPFGCGASNCWSTAPDCGRRLVAATSRGSCDPLTRRGAVRRPTLPADMMTIRRLGAAALACGLLLAGCGGGSDNSTAPNSSTPTSASTTGTTGTPRSTLQWHDCGSIQCAQLEVPVDATQPAGPKIELALARRRASGDRVGTLLVNPGGPGAPGLPVVEDASSYLPKEALERFDVVSWDTRGTGDSTNVACGNKLDYFFDTDKTPDSATEVATNVAAARRLANACVTTK